MVIGRRAMIQGLVLVIGGPAVVGRALAGPVTGDKIGDQVQTLPRGQLPDFAGPGTPGIRALYQYAVEHGGSSTSPASAGAGASATGATGIATSRRSMGTGA